MRGRCIVIAGACVAALLPGRAAWADSSAPSAPPPDESFLEFLGKDDVDDSKMWDFFKRRPPKDDEEADDDAAGVPTAGEGRQK